MIRQSIWSPTVLLLLSGLLSVERLAAQQDPQLALNSPLPKFETVEVPQGSTASKRPNQHKVFSANGPWGKLEYYVVHLQAPQSYLEYLQPRIDGAEWYFPDTDVNGVSEFLQTFDGNQQVGDDSEASARFTVEGDDVILYPNGDFIEALAPSDWQRLAERLRLDPRNRNYVTPVMIDSNDPFSWFTEAGVDESAAKLIEQLSYRHNGHIYFSEMPYVLGKQETIEARNLLTRVTTRTRALVVRLNVGESEDIEQVVNYWTAGFKRKDLLPILESVNEIPDVERIDIAHLLPPIPRMLLNTYPSLASLAEGDRRDCHWTCYNFFRSVPTPVYASTAARSQSFYETLEVVDEHPTFGDTIVISDRETEDILHSMIYIAADIVFTKNGNSVYQPWVLMQYGDVLKRYSLRGDVAVTFYRAEG